MGVPVRNRELAEQWMHTSIQAVRGGAGLSAGLCKVVRKHCLASKYLHFWASCKIIVKDLNFIHPRMEGESYSDITRKNSGLKNCIYKS